MSQSTDMPIVAAAASPSLADPVSCGEDYVHNLNRAYAIAPDHCISCNDYHIIQAAKRLVGETIWERASRKSLLNTLQPILAEIAARDVDRIDIVVAACADTGVLSTFAHAALRESEAFLNRTHFTVLDRCQTPLTLCQDYAEKYELKVESEAVDLSETTKNFPADIITVNNLLPFVPEHLQTTLLHRLGGWLNENGCIVLWNTVIPPGDHDHSRSRRQNQIATVVEKFEDGEIEIDEAKDVFIAKLAKSIGSPRFAGHRFADTNSVVKLVASAGLEIRSVEEILDPVGYRSKVNALVVAGRPSP